MGMGVLIQRGGVAGKEGLARKAVKQLLPGAAFIQDLIEIWSRFDSLFLEEVHEGQDPLIDNDLNVRMGGGGGG